MPLLFKHSYPLEAWLLLALDRSSPDIRVQVSKIVPIPDKCPITFEYSSDRSPEELESVSSHLELADSGDFYTGKVPEIEKVTVKGAESGGSMVITQWSARCDSAIYRESSRVLYLCAPSRVSLSEVIEISDRA